MNNFKETTTYPYSVIKSIIDAYKKNEIYTIKNINFN